MNLTRLALATSLALVSASGWQQQEPDIYSRATVRGIVTDTIGGALIGAYVQFQGEGGTYALRTEGDGRYSLAVKPGLYHASASIFPFTGGKRSTFIVQAGDDAELDFFLSNCGVADSFYLSSTVLCAYEDEELAPIVEGGLKPLVMFQEGGRKENGETVVYPGISLPVAPGKDRQVAPVVYSYDLMTIRCDNLVYTPKDHSIKGVGHVIWQDGTNARRGSEIRVSFSKGEPNVQLVN